MNGMTLTIKGLFGHFNYEIPLYGLESVDGIPMSDGVTILTGPNGYGKSTILRALKAISKGDLEFFVTLKFEELILFSEKDGKNLKMQKKGEYLIIDDEKFSFAQVVQGSGLVTQAMRETVNEAIQSFWDNIDPDTDMPIDGEFMLTRIREIGAPIAMQKLKNLQNCPPGFTRILTHFHCWEKALMITEQRLLDIQDVTTTSNGKQRKLQKVAKVIKILPRQMKVHFDRVFNRYSQVDTQLNASFPSRVLNQSGDDRLTEEEFNRLYQDMNDKLRVLRENGLSDIAQQDIPPFQSEKSSGLRVFFDDFNAKYQVYEPLIAKLTLFRKILDRRFRTFKRVEVSRKYGLRVLDIPADKNGEEVEIPLEKLSSGEQETLVLYYQLIFETAPGTMLLIDEPEISLHIAWQRHFIDELKEIVRLNDLRAVVATHSVSILNGNWDIEVNLEALHKDEAEA